VARSIKRCAHEGGQSVIEVGLPNKRFNRYHGRDPPIIASRRS
jgi:hypothetical protein